MKIIKKFKSETAHIVRNALSTRCAYSIHGHSYIYEIGIKGNVSEKDGMVLDFKALTPIKNFIDMFDHTCILWSKESDEIKEFFINNFERVVIFNKNPTAENMVLVIAKYVVDFLKNVERNSCVLSHIRIWETDTGSALLTSFDNVCDDDCIVFKSKQIELEQEKNKEMEINFINYFKGI